MDKISVLIVEDQLLFAENLKLILEDHDFEVVDIIDNGESVIEYVGRYVPDLILMDIQLRGQMDGIDTAQQLDCDIPIIYLSDHTDRLTVERAKNTFPANYLSKPFQKGDLLRALEIAFVNANRIRTPRLKSRLRDKIFIRIDHQNSKMIFYENIIYLEADRAYCLIVTEDKSYTLSNNMRLIADQIASPDFIKISRKHIININRVTAINGNMIELGHNHTLQMSKMYRDEVMTYFNLVK